MPEALENGRVEFADIDFLKESPLKDGDIYYASDFSSITGHGLKFTFQYRCDTSCETISFAK
jgi:hypothetical protein